jgi:hypothetical protein
VRLAKLYQHLAAEATQTGNESEALGFLQRGDEIATQLIASNPGVLEYVRLASSNNRQMGHNLRAGKRSREAMDSYRRARALLEPFARPETTDVDLINDLAKCWFDLATVQPPEDALQSLRQASELRAKLVAAHGDNLGLRYDFGLTKYNMATNCWNLGRQEEAIATAREGADQLRIAVERAPQVVTYRQAFHGTLDLLADMLRKVGRPKEAAEVKEERQKSIRNQESGVRGQENGLVDFPTPDS